MSDALFPTRRGILAGASAGAAAMLAVPAKASAVSAAPLPSTPNATVDVVIVGAGMSGLVAALALEKAGHSVMVLEANTRAGGRLKSVRVGGLTVDAGGMWFCAGHTRLVALIEELGLATYETHVAGDGIAFFASGHGRFAGEDPAPLFSPQVNEDYARSLEAFSRLESGIDPARPFAHPDAAALDTQSVDQWARGQSGDPTFLAGWDLTTRTVTGARSADVSLLSFLHYCRSAGGLSALSGLSDGGAQHRLVAGGLFQVADALAARLKGRIRFAAPVTAIAQDAAGVTVQTPEGSVRARRVISTAAPSLAARMTYTPPLSAARDGLMQHAPMASVIKFWIAYDRPFWRDSGLNGFVLSTEHAVSALFDVTPPSTGRGLIVGFFDGHEAVRWADRPQDARRDTALRLLQDAFGPSARDYADYTDCPWPSEPWARGCFGTYTGTGVLTRYGETILTPSDRIHWAGTFTSPVWTGHVEGAIRSGERAATEVHAVLVAGEMEA